MAESVAAMMLRAAAIDVAACRALAAAPGIADTVIGFHAQQACEKCLKAVLSAAGVEFSRTHDLVRLMDLADAGGVDFPAQARWIDVLNPYAVAARYGLVETGRLDQLRALATIAHLLEWAHGRLGHVGPT